MEVNETNLQEEEQLQENYSEQTANSTKVEEVSSELLEDALETLYDQGGFDLVGTTVEGADNMEPGAMRDVFLGDEENKVEREQLKKRFESFVKLLESTDNVGDMIEHSQAESTRSGELLNSNLKRALDATRTLEENYRSVAAFFLNAGGTDSVKHLTIMNASLDKITDLESPKFLEAVSNELKQKYDRLDLMNNYSLLAIPGYLKNKQVIDEWARTAEANKVMLVTDYRNLDNAGQIIKLFERDKLTGSDDFRANVMMACNWLVGREQYVEAGEKEPIYVPASAALAGALYSGNQAQPSAGVQHGVLRGAKGARDNILANDLAKLSEMGLIPMAFEFGQVQAMGANTLFNGTNVGMQKYSVVRTFDWLTKCLMDYLNRKVFINISVNEEMDITKEISSFFSKCVKEYKFLEKYEKVTVKRDPKEKDKVHVYVHATPFFPAQNFVLRLDGKSGESGNDYDVAME